MLALPLQHHVHNNITPDAHVHLPPHHQVHHQQQNNGRQPLAKTPITVVGIPSVSIQNNRLVVGSSQTSVYRELTLNICAYCPAPSRFDPLIHARQGPW